MLNLAYNIGVQLALEEEGVTKEAAPTSALSNAMRRWVAPTALSAGIGAGAGALASDEGNRGRGALIGGLAGTAFGLGRGLGRGNVDRMEDVVAKVRQRAGARGGEAVEKRMLRHPISRLPGSTKALKKPMTYGDYLSNRKRVGMLLGGTAALGAGGLAALATPKSQPTSNWGDFLGALPGVAEQYAPVAQQMLGVSPEMLAQQAYPVDQYPVDQYPVDQTGGQYV